MMVYNVAGLLKSHSGDTRSVEIEAWPDLGEPDIRLLSPLTGVLKLTRDHNGILAHGELTTRLVVPCSRCLGPAECDVTVDLAEHFQPTVYLPGGPDVEVDADADPELLIDQHHQLDLTEVIRQGLLLAVPMHPLCRPDCRGLCPQCGQDLNDGPCHCEEPSDPRWESLRVLLDDTAAT